MDAEVYSIEANLEMRDEMRKRRGGVDDADRIGEAVRRRIPFSFQLKIF